MAAAAAIIPIALAVVGGVVQGVSQYQQANEEADRAKDEGRRQMLEAYTAERRIRRRNAILLSQMETGGAKVGVSLSEGSPLEMIANNTAQLELEALDQRQAGINAMRAHRAAASQIRSQGKRALVTSIIGGIAQGASSGYQTGALSLGSQRPTPRQYSAPSIAYQQPTIYAPRRVGSP